jgi:transcriptional regulator with XRE-family HTH domain
MALDAKKSAAAGAKRGPIVAGEPPKLPTGELPSGKPQVVEINGTRMVLMPEADYQVLIEAARDNIEDLAAATDAIEILKRIDSGEEETFPAEIVNRVTHSDEIGESRIKIWREYRKMTQADLGAAVGSNRLYISQLETGVRNGSIDTLQKIAAALGVSVDLVVPSPKNARDADPVNEIIEKTGQDPIAIISARCKVNRKTARVIFGVFNDPLPAGSDLTTTLAARLKTDRARAFELIHAAVPPEGLTVSPRASDRKQAEVIHLNHDPAYAREPRNKEVVDVTDDREVHWWATVLSIVPDDLRDIVRRRGNKAKDIRTDLAERLERDLKETMAALGIGSKAEKRGTTRRRKK